MRAYLRQHHVGLTALLLVILSGSSAYAAATIGARDIKDNAIRSRHIKDGNVTGADANESTFDVSRVINRARGTGDVDLSTTPASYVLVQGASFAQAANESVVSYIGQISFDNQNCVGGGAPTLTITLKVGPDTIGSALVSTSGAAGLTTKTFTSNLTTLLFESAAATDRQFSVEVSHTACSVSGGPVRLVNLAINLIGVR